MLCELCGTYTHNMDKCIYLDSLVDRIDKTNFSVANHSQPQGGGCYSRGGEYQDGITRRIGGNVGCCDSNYVGHLALEFPLPR